MSYWYDSKPLRWNTFEWLMARMDERISDPQNLHRLKEARIQTLIAAGAYLGPMAVELLGMRWSDLRNSLAYFFCCEPHRQPLVIDPDFRQIVTKNYRLVQPQYRHELVLMRSREQRPYLPQMFNRVLAATFASFGLRVKVPTAYTLRRTFARKIWESEQGSEAIVKELATEFKMRKGSIKTFVRL